MRVLIPLMRRRILMVKMSLARDGKDISTKGFCTGGISKSFGYSAEYPEI